MHIARLPVLIYHFIRIAVKHSGCDRTKLLFQFRTGNFYCFACNIGCGRCIRTGIIRRRIRVGAEYRNIFNRTFHAFRNHLCKNRIAPGSHVCSPDDQVKGSVIRKFDRCRSDIHIRNTRSLHCHRNTGSSDFSFSHIPYRIFFIPVKQFFTFFHASVKSTGICSLAKISRHLHAFANHILFTDNRRVYSKLFRQFIHAGFHSKNSLRRPISAIGSGRQLICINHIIRKTMCFKPSGIKRNRFMSAQSYGCRSMFTISTGIGKSIQIKSTDMSVPVGAKAYAYFHLMSWRSCNHSLFSGKNKFCRSACFHGDKRRIYFTDRCLFCSKSTADTRLFNTYHAFFNSQCIR